MTATFLSAGQVGAQVVATPRHWRIVSEIKNAWHAGNSPDAAAALHQHPEIREMRSLAIDLAYEEYCLRRDRGESLETEEFVACFPSIRSSLRRQIEVYDYLSRNLAQAQGPPQRALLEPGDRILNFLILEELGNGGFGNVYLCEELGVGGRQVVIKIAHGATEEAETLGRLSHENIIPIYSVETDPGGHSIICMPFMGRSTFCDLVDAAFGEHGPPQSAELILEAARLRTESTDIYDRITPPVIDFSGAYAEGVALLAIQLSQALLHAHERGVLHGDIKPSNILLTPNGRPLLVDFNLAIDRRNALQLAGGTLPYMSPEQVRQLMDFPGPEISHVDERSDIFSFGAVFFELLCGEIPFPVHAEEIPTPRKRLEQLQRGARSLRQINPAVPAWLAAAVEQCLHVNAAQRPASFAVVAGQFKRGLRWPARLRRKMSQNRRTLCFGGLAAFLLTGLSGGYLTMRPSYAERSFRSGLATYHRGEYKQALSFFQEAANAEPEHAEVRYWLGRSRLKGGDLAGAASELQLAAGLDASGKSLGLWVYVLCQLNLFEVAIEKANAAIRSSEINAAILNNLGYSYLHRRHQLDVYYDQAEECFLRAAAMDSSEIAPHYNLALLEYQRGMRDEQYFPQLGLQHIQQAISLSPNGHLYLLAASLNALAARRDAAYISPALQNLEEARRQGIDLNEFGVQELPHFARLKSDPRWERILARSSSKNSESPPARLMEPAVPPASFAAE